MMPRYTVDEVAQAAYAAGFRGDGLLTAVAVAFPEGGQRDRKTGEWFFTTEIRGDVGIQTKKWGPSISPWQIRSLKAEHGKGTPRDAAALSGDLMHAARAAFVISDGGRNWRPWSAWRSKKHLGFVPRARQTIQSLGLTKEGVRVELGGGAPQDPAAPAVAEPSMQPQPVESPQDDRALLSTILTDVADHVAGGKRQLPKATPTEITLEELFPSGEATTDGE